VIVDLTDTIDLLQHAAKYIQASVRTVVAPDGEPDVASDSDAAAHHLACALSCEASRLTVTDPAMVKALANTLHIADMSSLTRSDVTKVKQFVSSEKDRFRASFDRWPKDSRSIRRLLELIDDYVELVIACVKPDRDADADRKQACKVWNDIRAEARRLANAS
jgi:hypothetical protein